MAHKFKFESLLIWQRAMDLAENMNIIIETFPQKERFNLSSQLLRASDSVALNISEGSIMQTVPMQIKYLNISIGSLAETVTCIHKAKRRNYITASQFDGFYLDCFNLMNMIIGYKNSLKRQPIRKRKTR